MTDKNHKCYINVNLIANTAHAQSWMFKTPDDDHGLMESQKQGVNDRWETQARHETHEFQSAFNSLRPPKETFCINTIIRMLSGPLSHCKWAVKPAVGPSQYCKHLAVTVICYLLTDGMRSLIWTEWAHARSLSVCETLINSIVY